MTGPRPRKRNQRKGVLAILSVLLLTSATLRLWDGPGVALAEAAGELAASPELATMPPDACLTEQETDAILSAFSGREARIVEQEGQIADRLQALKIAETEIEQRLAELIAAEDSLSQTLATASTAAETDVVNLTAVYENMKPRDAANLFAQMPPDFAAGFLARMRPDAAALILSGLEPEVSYAISVALAGRNAAAPSQ